jgi:hypothetical protein
VFCATCVQRLQEEERRKELEAASHNPFGRAGGGAPIRDAAGNAVTSLAALHQHNTSGGGAAQQLGAPQQPGLQSSAGGSSGWGGALAQPQLLPGMPLVGMVAEDILGQSLSGLGGAGMAGPGAQQMQQQPQMQQGYGQLPAGALGWPGPAVGGGGSPGGGGSGGSPGGGGGGGGSGGGGGGLVVKFRSDQVGGGCSCSRQRPERWSGRPGGVSRACSCLGPRCISAGVHHWR